VGPDLFLMVVLLLMLVTVGVVFLYYRRIRRAQEAYEEAKSVVGDVIISFNKQLERQGERLDTVTHKIDALSSESEKIVEEMKHYDGQMADLTSKIKATLETDRELSTRFKEVDERIGGLVTTQKEMLQKIEGFEKKVEREIPVMPEAKIKAAIPIKKERALAPLTETELNVLEVLAKEGRKTAPEIRERIKLTREHTARLMKKLYEDGYLERDTQKIPYTYRVREEMLKILRKGEAKA